MATKKVQVTTEDNITTETHTVKKDFWAQYSRAIIYAGAAVIIIIGGWYGYKKLIKEPKEQKAAEAIYPAEFLFDKMATTGFNKDSVNIVLNGGTTDGSKITGMLNIIKNFGGTDASNRAEYIAGACYLQVKDFNNAVKHLKEFDDNGAYQTEIKKYIMLGHAYAEQKKTDDALSAYKKAATINEKDDALTVDALIMAAAYAESLGKTKDAIELYQRAKNDYPGSQAVANGDVDKNLAKLGITE